MRRARGLGLAAGAVLFTGWLAIATALASTVRAQPPARPAPAVPQPARDTATARRDTVPQRPGGAPPTRGDTVRATRDSVTIAAPIPPRADSARIDSVKFLKDSLRARMVRDSIKAPFARAELPTHVAPGPAYRWTRDSLYTTGAVTLLDLLQRIPGITGFRSGWIASAQTAAYLGEFRRVRVFRDGVELDAVDPRSRGVLDVPDVQLWDLDEVMIERAAGEVRVHLRTWTVRNTTAYTRVDVATGDEETNLYRGYYGKRFTNGGALQIGAQQMGTGARNRQGGGGDATGVFARLGWARGRLSIDGVATRIDRTRNETSALRAEAVLLPRYEGRRDDGYLRASWGDPDRGTWLQAIASAVAFRLGGTSSVARVDTLRDSVSRTVTRIDTVMTGDTTAARTQYVLTGGFTRWGVRLSAADRFRVFEGRSDHAPALRASYESGLLAVRAFGERTGMDSTTRIDVDARLSPLPWVALTGAVSRASTARDAGGDLRRTTVRAEAAVRLGELWLGGGSIVRDATELPPAPVYANVGRSVLLEPRVTGFIGSARGRVYKDVYVDAFGLRWSGGSVYRPQYESRAELRLSTEWRRRFPTGNFGLNAAIWNEYRSAAFFPAPADSAATEITNLRAGPANVLNALLEIRIQRGWVTYQLRNALNREYELVPGIAIRGPISYYGVRWEFWN